MVAVDHHIEVIGHLPVELHAAATHRRHVFHPTHELVLGDDYRRTALVHRLESDGVTDLLLGRKLRLEHRTEQVLLSRAERHFQIALLVDQPLDDIGVDTHETRTGILVLEPADEMTVELAVHRQHVVPFAASRLDECVLRDRIGRIQADHVAVTVRLVFLDQRIVLGEREILAVGILHEREVGGLLGELFVGDDAVLDENLQIVPLFLELVAVLREQLAQPVGYLAGDVARNLLDVRVALQIAARHVQRDVGRVDHAVQQRQELGHDAFDRIGHEHLVRIELDLVLLYLEVVPYLREIENACQIERIVDVQVNIEQRVLGHRIERAVELHVLLQRNVRRLLGP